MYALLFLGNLYTMELYIIYIWNIIPLDIYQRLVTRNVAVNYCNFHRSQLLGRSVEANRPPSPLSWLQERILSRIYTYVFILSNIMHWRGGWGLFDAAVAAIIPDATNPHR